ncbi:zinc ABC transporter substrate-binding protein [Arcanobacterium haemolyticum]|nr:zinc ABC transporter substrate-binding protein [Arcanobacterium haemolyticum]
MKASRLAALAGAFALALGLTACSAPSTTSDGTVKVSASFYPLVWLTQKIGGDAVSVSSVTPTNVEPHDFELAPADISALQEAKAIVYVAGFQPSLDDAISEISGPKILELSHNVDLKELDADHADHDGHDHGAYDPHFWLDPERMIKAAEEINASLAKIAPDHASTFATNLENLKQELTSVDTSFTTGLANCERRTLVTNHSAFGYLTERYNLTQVSISGIDPESEPSPAELAKVKQIIAETGTTTIFTESLVSPKTAEALAGEAGVTTAELNPLESQPEGGDYLAAMQANLEALRTGLSCK